MDGVYSALYRLRWLLRGHRRAQSVARGTESLSLGVAGICYYSQKFPQAPSWQNGGGGQLKLLHLATRWPHVIHGARLCYIASSAADAGAHALVRKARKQGLKVVLNQDGITYRGWYGVGWSGPNRIERELFELADYVIYQSHFVERCLSAHWGPLSIPSSVILNPVDLDRFQPDSAMSQWLGAEGRPLVVLSRFTNSWHRRERLRLAVRAIGKLEELGARCDLRLVGADSTDEASMRLMKWLTGKATQDALLRRGLERTRIEGVYNWDTAADVLAKAHLCLHLGYNDPCPNFVAECLACGLPVVGLNCGGTPELVGAAGVLLPVEESYTNQPMPDAEAVAQEIFSVATRLSDLRVTARSQAEAKLSIDTFFRKHESIFSVMK